MNSGSVDVVTSHNTRWCNYWREILHKPIANPPAWCPMPPELIPGAIRDLRNRKLLLTLTQYRKMRDILFWVVGELNVLERRLWIHTDISEIDYVRSDTTKTTRGAASLTGLYPSK